MRSLVALSLALVLAGCGKPSRPAPVDPNGRVDVVIPNHGAYTGAFMDFGDAEDDVRLETIEDFEEMVGKHQAIIVSSSYWGEQNFPTDNLNVIWRHGSLPLVFWSPWDKPYEEDRGPDKFSLNEILAGKWDAYIDKWADALSCFVSKRTARGFPGQALITAVRNGFRNSTIGKARKRFGERTDMWWTASARAARQTSSGCFIQTTIRTPTKPGTALRRTILDPITSIGLGLAFMGSSTRTSPIRIFPHWLTGRTRK
jgi:hypothetical protein